MNNFKRYLFGFLSSFLLAAGFAQAADRFDPMTQALHRATLTLQEDGTPPPDDPPPISPSCIDDGNDN